MTNTELIIEQAKELAEQNRIIAYYREHCESLENALRVKENITESGDDLPLTPAKEAENNLPVSPEGVFAKCKTIMA